MRKVIRRRIRRQSGGVDLAMDINAAVAANSRTTGAESVQSTSVTQTSSARAGDEGRDRPAGTQDQTPKEER
jgi:hypothetical protein